MDFWWAKNFVCTVFFSTRVPGRGTLCGYEYKSHIAVDSTLLLSALGVSSIYYTFWLSRESNLRLICPGRSQLQKEDLQVVAILLNVRYVCYVQAWWLNGYLLSYGTLGIRKVFSARAGIESFCS